MHIKALKNFSGLITMSEGEERNVRDEIAEDLIHAGYAERIGKAAKPDPGQPAEAEREPEQEKRKETAPERPAEKKSK